MTESNYTYIKEILMLIESKGIKDADYKEELLDHYCTVYESRARTNPHDQIINDISQSIQKGELLYRKSKSNMYKNALIFASLTFLMWTLFNPPLAPQSIPNTLEVTTYIHPEEPPFGNPLALPKIKITSGYGEKMHPFYKVMKFHKGIDLQAPTGTEVIGVADGKVMESAFDKKKGNYIVIEHDTQYKTKYYHLNSRKVKKGDIVKKGDVIGEVGSTGLSTGPHLHYEILKDDESVDPSTFVRA